MWKHVFKEIQAIRVGSEEGGYTRGKENRFWKSRFYHRSQWWCVIAEIWGTVSTAKNIWVSSFRNGEVWCLKE